MLTKKAKLNIFWITLIIIGLGLSLASFYKQAETKYQKYTNLEKEESPKTNTDRHSPPEALQASSLYPDKSPLSFWKNSREVLGFKEPRTYLILFQNSHEMRPTGGYIGSFGLVRLSNGRIKNFELHNTNVFDYLNTDHGGIKDTPWPFEKYLNIHYWGLRDVNWNPDFPTTAQKAMNFYHDLGGEQNLDGVLALTPEVLEELLAYTGPVKIEGYEGVFDEDNVIDRVQYDVERGFLDKGLKRGERKKIMRELASKIISEVKTWNPFEIPELVATAEELLGKKYIQIFSSNPQIQAKIKKAGWAGALENSEKDYLALIDCNLGALKTDRVIKREMTYEVDFTENKRARATLKISYKHEGKSRDWRTSDYKSFMRLFVSKGSWLENSKGLESEVHFMDEHEKTVFGGWLQVPLGSQKSISFEYLLPKEITSNNYSLVIQKQAGLDNIPLDLKLITNKKTFKKELNIDRDTIIELQ